MKRRGFIKNLVGWAAAPAVLPAINLSASVRPNALDVQMVPRAAELSARLAELMGMGFSGLIKQGQIPKDAGYNYQSVVYQRNESSGVTPEQSQFLDPAITIHSWTAQMRMIRSELIRRGENPDQIAVRMDNLARSMAEIWEEKDIEQYAQKCEVLEFGGFPSRKDLDNIHRRYLMDGGDDHCIAESQDGEPLAILCVSMNFIRSLIKRDIYPRGGKIKWRGRTDLRSTLERAGVYKHYGPFIMRVILRLPRMEMDNSIISQFNQQQDSKNITQVVNPRFGMAPKEDVFLFDPEVMHRMVPDLNKPYGDINWVNIQNTDKKSQDYNPRRTRGRFYGSMQAGWRPLHTHLGKVIRCRRCAA